MTTPHLVETTGTGIVEHVARAIDQVQLGWRYNNWTSDRVEGFPIEVFRSGEPEVILCRFPGDVEDGVNRLFEAVSAYRSKAAIRATIEHLRDNVSDGMKQGGFRAVDRQQACSNYAGDGVCIRCGYGFDAEDGCGHAAVAGFRAMLDAALAELDHPSSPEQEVEKP